MTENPFNAAPRIEEVFAEFGTTVLDYRRIFNALDVGMVVQLDDYSIAACNAAAERILGLSSDQIYGRTSNDPRWQAVHEDGTPFGGQENPAIVSIDTGRTLRNVIMGVRTPEGQLRWISVNSDPIYGPNDDKPFAAVTTFSDITEQRKIESELATRYQLENACFASTQLLIGLRGAEFDRGVESTLGAISEIIGADRAYVMYLDDAGEAFNCTHEWCAPRIPSFHRDRPPVAAEPYAWLGRDIGNYETVDLPEVDVSERRQARNLQLLAERGCEAAMFLPLSSARGLVGFVGFDQVHARPWPGTVRPVLRSLVDGLTNFLENQRLEALTRESEDRYRLLAEQATDLILSLDAANHITFASPSAFALVGRSATALEGHSLFALIHPEDVGRYATGVAAPDPIGGVIRSTLRLQHADGSWVWFECFARPAFDPETGALVSTTATLRDVSDRVAVMSELQESESRLRLITDENPVGIIEVDLDGVCTYVNPTLARMVGRIPSDLLGAPVENWIDAESMTPVSELAAAAINGRAAGPVEIHTQRSDGSVLWVVVRCVALRGADGQLIGILGTAEDITQRKAAEEAVRLSEERFRSLVQNASDIITVLEPDGGWRYSSPAGSKQLGWPEGVTPEGGIFALVHPDDVEVAARTLSEVLAGTRGPNDPIVFRVQRSDGEYVFLETKGQNFIDDPAVNGILLISRDITDRLRAQEDLASARDAALAALQAKREFIAVVSHELRTPMHAVLGLSELLGGSDLDGEQRLYVDSIHRSVKSLSAVVDDILDYTRAEAGRLELHYSNFNPANVVNDVVTLLGAAATDKGLVLDAEVARDVPALVAGDPDRMRQVVTNLVANAVKYTDAGSVHVEVTAAIANDDEVTLRVAVRDTGIGIASDVVDRLFEPFEQGEGTTWRRYGGAGLGLAICRQLVTLMNGELTVDSTVGFGSEFVATMRVHAVEIPRMTVKVTVPRRSAGNKTRPQILVVEDNEVNQLLVDRQLATLEYDATIVPDGPTALEYLQKQHWDAVLLDVQLPGMDGLEVALRYRAEAAPDRSRVPIIAMTASAMAGDRDACIAAGMDDYLAKPVGIELLRAMLDRWVQGVEALPRVAPDQPSGSLDTLAAELGGDRTTVARMATMFLTELAQRRAAIERAQDAAQFGAAVHALASASAALSLTGLFNACRAAEQAAKQGQQFDRVTHESAIDAAITRSIGALDDWLAAEVNR
jgi:PAS domain S-box-containing protein